MQPATPGQLQPFTPKQADVQPTTPQPAVLPFTPGMAPTTPQPFTPVAAAPATPATTPAAPAAAAG
eukprot:10789518-Alexandrium_andersonii.AAC.1